MFCVHCGAQIDPEHQFCGSCGKATGPAPAPLPQARLQPAAQSTLETHIPILGVLWLLRGGLRLLGAAWIYFVGARLMPWMAGWGHWHMDDFVVGFLPSLIKFSAITYAAIAIGSLATGFGLLQREEWARPLAIVMGFLALLSIPFGTALGVYTLWALLPARSGTEYNRLARAH